MFKNYFFNSHSAAVPAAPKLSFSTTFCTKNLNIFEMQLTQIELAAKNFEDI